MTIDTYKYIDICAYNHTMYIPGTLYPFIPGANIKTK